MQHPAPAIIAILRAQLEYRRRFHYIDRMLMKTLQAETAHHDTIQAHKHVALNDGAVLQEPTQSAPDNYKRPEKARINFDVSPKLMVEIRRRAIAQGLTVRAYMLKLLAAEGLDTLDPELADGRTLRAASMMAAKSA